MADSNYEALGRGLKLYTDAMREPVKQRLVACFPNSWWEDGVLKSVSDGQRNQLRRDVERNPRNDRADFLEASILVPIPMVQPETIYSQTQCVGSDRFIRHLWHAIQVCVLRRDQS